MPTPNDQLTNILNAFSSNYGGTSGQFDGMRVEYRAGLRQTLEVLIAQETLTSAQVSLATARHDAYVADALLLNAVGRREARVLLQGQPLYQPQVSFRRNERKDAVPWEAVPRGLDRIGVPGVVAPEPLPEPSEATGPASISPEGAIGSTLQLSRSGESVK